MSASSGLAISIQRLKQAIAVLRTNIIAQDGQDLADALLGFVKMGSEVHRIAKEDLTVVAFDSDKSKIESTNTPISEIFKLLLKGGSKFFDALFYVGLDSGDRPKISYIAIVPDKKKEDDTGMYGDPAKITDYIFYTYFYLMIRAHAPSAAGPYTGQTVPNFLTAVMALTDPPAAIAKYLASFDLNKINPSWIEYIPTVELGKEAQTRFALGVAGYRICSVFWYYKPDHPDADQYATPFDVAKSFLGAGLDWAFHPATRDPNILTKYGNINKNCSNLILKLYTEATIKLMVASKKLASMPVYDPSHSQFEQWTVPYQATRPIFPKKK